MNFFSKNRKERGDVKRFREQDGIQSWVPENEQTVVCHQHGHKL